MVKKVYGLNIVYDRKKYQIIVPDGLRSYSVGSVICEYMRFKPQKLKKIVLSMEDLDDKPSEKILIDSLKK